MTRSRKRDNLLLDFGALMLYTLDMKSFERDDITQFRNLRFLRFGRLAVASTAVEAVGAVVAFATRDLAWLEIATLAAGGNVGFASQDCAINAQSRYLGGLFRTDQTV